MGKIFDEILADLAKKKEKVLRLENDVALYGKMYKDWESYVKAKKKEYKEYTKTSGDALGAAQKDYYGMLDENITVRLGDLIRALANRQKIDLSKVDIRVSPNIWLADWEDLESACEEGEKWHNLVLTIKSKPGEKPLLIEVGMPLEFDRVQGDGRTLFDHCAIKESDAGREVIIGTDIEDLLCDFGIGEVSSKIIPGATGISSGALADAIVDAYEKYAVLG